MAGDVPSSDKSLEDEPQMTDTQHALGIREILAHIFKYLTHRDFSAAAELLRCAQVNHLWWEEAARFLWEKCGAGWARNMTPRSFPILRELSAMKHNPKRMQFYAGCIKSLRIIDSRERSRVV